MDMIANDCRLSAKPRQGATPKVKTPLRGSGDTFAIALKDHSTLWPLAVSAQHTGMWNKNLPRSG
jgi:hypothetical protein